MASSSTSSTPKSFKYEVFLSFRGEDTRKNFVDHLYSALEQKGIYTYKDDERIKKGKMVNDELIKSIKDSEFYIIVFSKNYASSSWCLGELVEIMECHKTGEHTAYPVFYDVEPTEVRKQSGAVGEAFAKHEKDEAAGKWRKALEEAAGLAGWELKDTANGHEAKFIQKIIEEISSQLHSISSSSDEKWVGLETQKKDVISSLETNIDDVRMIGIKGMGGAGKTTLARAVFDQISYLFDGNSFVENVREVSSDSSSGLKSLQCQALSDVLNDKDIRVSTVQDGKNMMKRRMRGRKVLIVLDDVDNIKQLEALAGELNWFKSGSRIIITTRDEKVLPAHRGTLIYDVKLLSDEDAVCLFSSHAFETDMPIQGYQELSEQVVRYAAGLPLTITVLGSSLCGENKPIWEDTLKRLKKIPLVKTQEILELSYSVLEDVYREMFLDVACIMKGWSKDTAIKALESCGFHAKSGLRVLQQKSLITIKGSPRYELVGMHDSIEEMGRNIVRRSHPDMPEKHSRLWIDGEIEHILANDLGTEETRCIQFNTGLKRISLSNTMNLDPNILIKGLGKMKTLRFLAMGTSCFRNPELNTCSPSFPEALGYLSLEGYPFRSLPITFQANNLVTLELFSREIVQLWEGGERKVLKKLRFLKLNCLKLSSLDLGLAPNLETLTLQSCSHLVELPDVNRTLRHLKSLEIRDCSLLQKLPEDLGQLRCLEMLDLSAINIKHLPDSICMLKHLKYLLLNRCRFLEKLPEDLGWLECLEELSLSYTNIKHLPDSISMLKHLRKLKLDNCSLLEQLPEDLGQLECLEKLDLSSIKIKYLPDGIGMLKNLNALKLTDCSLLEELPEDLSRLECLKSLYLSKAKIKHLPDSICMLKQLESLDLVSCLLLEKLPEDLGQLDCLKSLHLLCAPIKHLPDSIVMLKNLNDLRLDRCLSFEKLPEDLGRLESLKSLHLSSTNVKHLPDSICVLEHLYYLKLDGCLLLEKLPEDLGRLECLKSLHLSSTKIKHLPDSICMLKHLYSLELCNCLLLEKLPDDLGRLLCLEKLQLRSTNITHLPDSICMLKYLKDLHLNDCKLVEKLPEDLGRLECLKSLHLSGTKIKHLPDSIVMLKNLNDLFLGGCLSFEKLPEDLGRLECLKSLHLSSTKIKHLPNSICMLKHLHDLVLSGCLSLEKLPEDLGRLESLEKLQLSYTKIRDLPDSICKLQHLASLELDHMSLLEQLPKDLGHLDCLERLELSSTNIRHLPDSICELKRLRYFEVRGCSLLEKLPEDFGLLEFVKRIYIDGTCISDIPQSIRTKGRRIYGSRERLELCGFTFEIRLHYDLEDFESQFYYVEF